MLEIYNTGDQPVVNPVVSVEVFRAPEANDPEFKTLIKRQGLRTQPSKDAVVRPGKAAIITGAVRDGGQLRLRNKHHNSIVTLQDRIANGEDVSINQLRGRVAAARSVEPVAAVRLEARLDRILNSDVTA